MKYLLFIIVFVAANLHAQSILQFDKKFIESEDRWVAHKMTEDSMYSYGFIYIDPQAGLTFNHEGRFKISSTGTFIPEKLGDESLKVRLENNNVLVAFIPENKFEELQITATPDWLGAYKTDTGSIERLYRWGFTYNGWDLCAKALTYLEKAQKIDPHYKGLEIELAYSYNCLGQYDKAILVLENALKAYPTDAYFYKELIYAQIKLGQFDKASGICKKAISVCSDTTYNGENCYNLLHECYMKKDKKIFSLWLEDTKKWNADKPKLINSIKFMEGEMSK